MTPKLSPRTVQLVELLFSPKDIPEAVHWLEEECGLNLSLIGKKDEYSMERIRFAVIKLSGGSLLKLLEAIDVAQKDWRDLLMMAGFGFDADAHEIWAKEVFENI